LVTGAFPGPRRWSTRRWLLALLFSGTLLFLLPSIALADPKVTVTPDKVAPGQTVTVSGSGWARFDQILVSFTDPSGNIIPIGVISADANGNFQQQIPVPTNVVPGTYQVDGNGEGGSVSVVMTILAPTPVPAPPTAVPSSATPVAPTPAVAATATPVPGEPSPTFTVPSTTTSTATVTPTPTDTFTPTVTPTETPTPTDTATPTATATFTSTPTSTPTPTNTPTLPEQVVQVGGGPGPFTVIVALILALAGVSYLAFRRR
jgi:hypothetical protein